jgi:hypothetical protein
MTLAAQILAMSTIRHEGRVRALLYSGNVEKAWEWMRSEREVSRFLMNYIGGGTEFPFDILAASARECRTDPPIRVVITDPDFDWNLRQSKGGAKNITNAAEGSRTFVLLLHRPAKSSVDRYRLLGAQVVPVDRLDDFPRLAADLARSLFGGARRAP